MNVTLVKKRVLIIIKVRLGKKNILSILMLIIYLIKCNYTQNYNFIFHWYEFNVFCVLN